MKVVGRLLDVPDCAELLGVPVVLFAEAVFEAEVFWVELPCVELLCNGTMVIVGQRLWIYKIAAQAATTDIKTITRLVFEKCLSMC